MPRIDPNQLLRCLSVLLSTNGGVKSKDEVQRLASLMTKFSKKLVSKCIYILILKQTEADLLDMFMSAGGWDLTFNWLSDGIEMRNWPLVAEMVELLLVCPVDIERLKGNNCPKLIKLLSKDQNATDKVRALACQVVDQWLAVVKGACTEPAPSASGASTSTNTAVPTVSVEVPDHTVPVANSIEPAVHPQPESKSEPSSSQTYKITIRDGKDVLAEVSSERGFSEEGTKGESDGVDSSNSDDPTLAPIPPIDTDSEDEVPTRRKRPAPRDSDEDYEPPPPLPKKVEKKLAAQKAAIKRPLDKPKDKKKAVLIEGSPEKKAKLDAKKRVEVIKKKRELERSKEKTSKEVKIKPVKEKTVQEERDNATLNKLITPSIANVGKIPKKSKTGEVKKDAPPTKETEVMKPPPVTKDPKKYNFTIETRKGMDDRPKTVKTFNARFRSTGLEEPPPPPKKKAGERSKDKEDKERNKEAIKKIKKPFGGSSPAKDEGPSKSPAHVSSSPAHVSSSPAHVSSSPAHVSSSPAHVSSSPAHVSSSPAHVSSSPAHVSSSPAHMSSPVHVKESPSHPSSSPTQDKKKEPSDKDKDKEPKSKTEKTEKVVSPPPKKHTALSMRERQAILANRSKNSSALFSNARGYDCLMETDFFAAALTAAQPVKASIKKKKRRTSTTDDIKKKEVTTSSTTPPASNKSADDVKPVFKFYQDTLITSEDKKEKTDDDADDVKPDVTKMETPEDDDNAPMTKEELEDEVARAEEAIDEVLKQESKKNVERERNRLPKGVLVYVKKKKGLKKSVMWKIDGELESIRYFELDETERVNVTKSTFLDMKQLERVNERMLLRKIATDDRMEEKIPWRRPPLVDLPADVVSPGKNSQEKDIQSSRERTTLQAIYFSRNMIPDTPGEPDLEIHAATEPTPIPLEDQTGNTDSVISYKEKPWPEPKGFEPGHNPGGPTPGAPICPPVPHVMPMPQEMMPPMPEAMMGPGPPGFPPQGGPFPGPYPMGGPMMPGPEWMPNGDGSGMMMGADMMMGGMPPGMPPGAMGPGMGMGPGMMGPPDMFNPMGGPPGPDFMGQFMGGPPPPGMPFPGPVGPQFPGPGGPGGPPMNNDNRQQRPWFRQNGPQNNNNGGSTWRHPSKGGGGKWGKSVPTCKYIINKGFCRAKNCQFKHPNNPKGNR